MNADLAAKANVGNGTVQPSQALPQVHRLGNTQVNAPLASTANPRAYQGTATQFSFANTRVQTSHRFRPFAGSLLRRQLSMTVNAPTSKALSITRVVPSSPRNQPGVGNVKVTQLNAGSEMRVLKTSGGIVTVQPLGNLTKQTNAPVLGKDSRTVQQRNMASGEKYLPRSPLLGTAKMMPQVRSVPQGSVVTQRRMVPKPVHITGPVLSQGSTSAVATVVAQSAGAISKVSDNTTPVNPPESFPSIKNLAVVHPQVRALAPSRQIIVEDLAKNVLLSKNVVQGHAVAPEQPRSSLTPQQLNSHLTPMPQILKTAVPTQGNAIAESTKPRVSLPAPQTMNDASFRSTKVIHIDLTDSVEAGQVGLDKLSELDDGVVEVSPPSLGIEDPLPRDMGFLQVPSGLKVDFINLDDLLIGDLNYLARYFGLSILEPLSMDDIANKGLSEWIDISDETQVEKVFLELEALNGSTSNLGWTNQHFPEGSDIAFPIVVPEYEDGDTGLSTRCPTKQSNVSSTPRPIQAVSTERRRMDSPTKSPLILIIKKGANSSNSSPAWQLSPYKACNGKESKDNKAHFLNGLNLHPSSGEQLKKMRKGKSARSLAVLKDKVMSEYLKNHHVPLHRVQGMYRYLFKKGHLREGKLTYACEVYRNLRSREGRQKAVTLPQNECEDLPKKGSSSPGLLWHLTTKKNCSKYEYDEDYVPRRNQAGKASRNLWGRPKSTWRCGPRRRGLQRGDPVAESPPYMLEQGNWTPKCTGEPGDWSIWVSENSLESKRAHPAPVVFLQRVDQSSTSAPSLPTSITELCCGQCLYSCLNKTSLSNHFDLKHHGMPVIFEEVVMSHRTSKAVPCENQDAKT